MNSRIVLLFAAGLLLQSASANALDIYYGDDRQAPLVECDVQAYAGNNAAADACYKRLLQHQELLVQANAAVALGDVRSANRLFRQAASESNDPLIKTHWAKLYMNTHQVSDAVSLYREALLVDDELIPARLGLVEATMRTYEGEARQELASILAEDPDNIKALLLQTRIELELQNTDNARTLLARVKPLMEAAGFPLLEHHTLQAGANLLDAEPIDEWVEKALAINPVYGDIYSTVAHFYIITYRYREAVELYQKAVELNPSLATAHRDLGINYLRINNLFNARYHIKKAFVLDPFDAQTVNTLRLMDKLDGMRISSIDVTDPDNPDTTIGRVIIRLDQEDADALEPYVHDLAERAMRVFSERYQFRLKRPMIVELYHDHDDFGVRTVSTPGIGLLGVTFGYLTAMDSPKARPAGDFHWGSTLWHEIAHVFTLEATNHLLPRWMSEGLSVYEEWNTGPLKDRTVPMETLLAISRSDLLPIDQLDSGFVRPTYNAQVQVSYHQAGMICDFISKKWGHDALVVMLQRFGQGDSTSEALTEAIGMDGPAFDVLFNAHVEEQYGAMSRLLDEYQVVNRQVARAVGMEDWASVAVLATDLIERDPNRVAAGNAYELLARALREQGDAEGAIDVLTEWHALGGHGFDSLFYLASELREQGKLSESADVLESINWVNPYNADVHSWLGHYYLESAETRSALREYNALLGLQPSDPATALLGKARASKQLGQNENAKRQVLYALEHAPFYRPAQQLLLEFHEGEHLD